MLIPFTDGLMRTSHYDQECRALADRLNRHSIGLELNPAYVHLARSRIQNDAPLLQPPAEPPAPPFALNGTLFD